MSRRMKIGLATGLTALLVSGAGLAAFAGHARDHRHAWMKRMVAAAVDDALDAARVTPEQRAQIHAARDRVLAAFEAHRQSRHARLDETLALFEADAVDAARVEVLRREAEERHRHLWDVVAQAVADVHATLDAGQRRALADYVRAHRHHRDG